VSSWRRCKHLWDLGPHWGKSAVPVQSALLWISQPDFQNQSLGSKTKKKIKWKKLLCTRQKVYQPLQNPPLPFPPTHPPTRPLTNPPISHLTLKSALVLICFAVLFCLVWCVTLRSRLNFGRTPSTNSLSTLSESSRNTRITLANQRFRVGICSDHEMVVSSPILRVRTHLSAWSHNFFLRAPRVVLFSFAVLAGSSRSLPTKSLMVWSLPPSKTNTSNKTWGDAVRWLRMWQVWSLS